MIPQTQNGNLVIQVILINESGLLIRRKEDWNGENYELWRIWKKVQR